MSEEFITAEFRLTADPLLLPAVVAAAEHFGQRRGLDESAVQSLMRAAKEACESTFKLLSKEAPTLGVLFTEYNDRIELIIEHKCEALPTAGLDTFLNAEEGDTAPGDLSGYTLMTLVDRVQYQTEGGTQRMTLVKNVSRKK